MTQLELIESTVLWSDGVSCAIDWTEGVSHGIDWRSDVSNYWQQFWFSCWWRNGSTYKCEGSDSVVDEDCATPNEVNAEWTDFSKF